MRGNAGPAAEITATARRRIAQTLDIADLLFTGLPTFRSRALQGQRMQ